MLRLDNVNTVLQAVLASPIATTNPQAVVCYSDDVATSATYTGGKQVTALNGTTDVTILSAPAASTVRDVDFLSIHNRDTATVNVTVKYDVSATDSTIIRVTLLTLETLTYTHGDGWKVLDASGAIKSSSSGSPTGTAGGDLSGTYPNPTVSRINGATLGTTTATSGRLLIADGSAWQSVALSGDVTVTSGGVVTISAGAVNLTTDVTGTLPAVNGGTGLNTFAVGDLLYANTTTTLARLADVAAGSHLRSGGVGVAPLWSTTTWPNSATTGDLLYASASNTYSNLADVATGNVLLSGGVGVAPAYGKVDLTTHVTGTLPVANGGTGRTTLTDGGLLVGNGTSGITQLAVATNGQLPIGSTGNDPVLATLTATANQTTVTNGSGTITLGTAQDIATGSSPTFAGATLTGLLNISGASAGQIQFPATQNPSANANTLDDYEEGTWTANISFGGGTTGITYTAQVGRYVKIGHRVIISATIVLSNKGSSTGTALVTGLPFTSENVTLQFTSVSNVGNVLSAGINSLQAFIGPNSNTISLSTLTGGASVLLNDTNFTNTTNILLGGSYPT